MPAKSSSDIVAQVAASVVANDKDLQARVRRIVNGILDDTEYIIEFGTEAARTSLAKAMIPGMIRALQTADQAHESGEAAAAYERLRKEFSGSFATGAMPVPTDTPP